MSPNEQQFLGGKASPEEVKGKNPAHKLTFPLSFFSLSFFFLKKKFQTVTPAGKGALAGRESGGGTGDG